MPRRLKWRTDSLKKKVCLPACLREQMCLQAYAWQGSSDPARSATFTSRSFARILLHSGTPLPCLELILRSGVRGNCFRAKRNGLLSGVAGPRPGAHCPRALPSSVDPDSLVSLFARERIGVMSDQGE